MARRSGGGAGLARRSVLGMNSLRGPYQGLSSSGSVKGISQGKMLQKSEQRQLNMHCTGSAPPLSAPESFDATTE